MKNCIVIFLASRPNWADVYESISHRRPHYQKLKPLKLGFIEIQILKIIETPARRSPNYASKTFL